ncbi:hypothetical protein FKP32DRAFT_222321 [Trametes sanguinea]|nr:hypothetical protein FKP32DRAFT_222321 [Trametes sanguinea]
MSSGLQYDLQRMPVPAQSLGFHPHTSDTIRSFQPGLRFSSDLHLPNLGDVARHLDDLDYGHNFGHLADPLKSVLPSAQGPRSSLLLATASSPSLRKHTDVSLTKTSSTLIETRSLLHGTKHLSRAHGSYTRTVQTPSPPLDPPLRPARPSLDSTRSTSSNRTMTVQRLALDLPLSSGGSLSALIHALEDAAPGWYQSLMDTITPQDPSPTPSPVLGESPSHRQGPEPRCRDESAAYGLSADMLASLDALEAVAARVRQLPVPKPKSRVFEDIGAAFVCSPDPTELTFKSYMPQLVSPPSTPPEDQQRRRQASNATLSPGETPRMRSRSSSATSYRSASTHTIAVSNIVNHPKLSKTLGLSAGVSGGVSASSNPAAMDVQPIAAETPHVLHKKASTKSLKTPKTPKTLKSIFRSKPPPVPSLPDYDEDDSPIRKPPLKYRFSDGSVLRREDRRIDSVMSIKRPFGSDSAPGRHIDADSFLFL